MGYYIKHKKNYWDRKIFNQDDKFDIVLEDVFIKLTGKRIDD